MKKKDIIIRVIFFSLAIAFTVLIFVSSLLNGQQSTKESGWLVNFLAKILNAFNKNAVTEDNYDNFAGIVRKLVGHFGLFLIDGIFVTISAFLIFKKKYWFYLYSLIFGLALALLTEGIQLMIPQRSGELRDSLIDFSGYIISASIVLLVYYLYKRKGENKLNEES